MAILIPGIFTETQLYIMYDLYKQKERELEAKDVLTAIEEIQLADAKTAIIQIEAYSVAERAKGLKWSLTSIWKDSGYNPTLILYFYPGSDAYATYGKQLVANVEFSDADMIHIFESMRDNAPRIAGQLNFKIIPSLLDGEVNTGDIFAIQ